MRELLDTTGDLATKNLWTGIVTVVSQARPPQLPEAVKLRQADWHQVPSSAPFDVDDLYDANGVKR